jgi:hypothetical protein
MQPRQSKLPFSFTDIIHKAVSANRQISGIDKSISRVDTQETFKGLKDPIHKVVGSWKRLHGLV